MKPTPATRPVWLIVPPMLAGLALLGWGCGHSRQVVYPDRKVSPPRVPRGKLFRSKKPVATPPVVVVPPGPAEPRPVDPPTVIDVPMIDRLGNP